MANPRDELPIMTVQLHDFTSTRRDTANTLRRCQLPKVKLKLKVSAPSPVKGPVSAVMRDVEDEDPELELAAEDRRRSPSCVLMIFRVSLYHSLLFLNRHFRLLRTCRLLRRLHITLQPPLLPFPPHLNNNHNNRFSYNHHNVPPEPLNGHLTSRVRVRHLAIRTNDTSASRGGIRWGVMFSRLHPLMHANPANDLEPMNDEDADTPELSVPDSPCFTQ